MWILATHLENAQNAGNVVETQEGHVFECPRYGLKMNRHKAASINIRRRYLEGKRRARMRGYPTAMNLRKL
jgi:transposase